MRTHRHQMGRANRRHSVRAHHDQAWDWCAHREEIEHHLVTQRHHYHRLELSEQLKLQTAS